VNGQGIRQSRGPRHRGGRSCGRAVASVSRKVADARGTVANAPCCAMASRCIRASFQPIGPKECEVTPRGTSATEHSRGEAGLPRCARVSMWLCTAGQIVTASSLTGARPDCLAREGQICAVPGYSAHEDEQSALLASDQCARRCARQACGAAPAPAGPGRGQRENRAVHPRRASRGC